MLEAVYVGVLRLELRVGGARSRKDRRQALTSLRDRVRHRFAVTWSELDDGSLPERAVVVCTSAGGSRRELQSVLERVRHFVEESHQAWPIAVDLDVSRWHPEGLSAWEDDEGG